MVYQRGIAGSSLTGTIHLSSENGTLAKSLRYCISRWAGAWNFIRHTNDGVGLEALRMQLANCRLGIGGVAAFGRSRIDPGHQRVDVPLAAAWIRKLQALAGVDGPRWHLARQNPLLDQVGQSFRLADDTSRNSRENRNYFFSGSWLLTSAAVYPPAKNEGANNTATRIALRVTRRTISSIGYLYELGLPLISPNGHYFRYEASRNASRDAEQQNPFPVDSCVAAQPLQPATRAY